MAKKVGKRIYEPLEKVIVTREQMARIGYVVADRNGNTGVYGKGMWQVRIALHLEDAQEHRYKLTNYDYVLPYSDDLWNAFERWRERQLQLLIDFHTLQRGTIPAEYQPVVQGSLFSNENTRPIERE